MSAAKVSKTNAARILEGLGIPYELHTADVDENAILLETLFVSAGQRGVQLRLKPDDLLRAVEGQYAPVARI